MCFNYMNVWYNLCALLVILNRPHPVDIDNRRNSVYLSGRVCPISVSVCVCQLSSLPTGR